MTAPERAPATASGRTAPPVEAAAPAPAGPGHPVTEHAVRFVTAASRFDGHDAAMFNVQAAGFVDS